MPDILTIRSVTLPISSGSPKGLWNITFPTSSPATRRSPSLHSPPSYVPRRPATHLLKNPEQYITKVGRFLRRTSLDELPQIFNILKGDMAVVGPRPALWNQYDLIAERDKYGANDLRPGLTGWAQINGRDELEISVKAKLDGDYTDALLHGKGFRMDCRCFFGTFLSVLREEGVVEGGTGSMHGAGDTPGKEDRA